MLASNVLGSPAVRTLAERFPGSAGIKDSSGDQFAIDTSAQRAITLGNTTAPPKITAIVDPNDANAFLIEDNSGNDESQISGSRWLMTSDCR